MTDRVRIPTAEPELELAIVGSLLMSPEAYQTYADDVMPEWFSEPFHALLFEAGKDAHLAGHKISPRTIIANLPEDCGGMKREEVFAAACAQAAPATALGGMLDVLKDRWSRRMLLEQAESIKLHAPYRNISPYDLASDVIECFDTVNAVKAPREVGMLQEGLTRLIHTLDRPDDLRGVTTGLQSLDQRLNGFKRGQLYVLAGRPGMGKSAIMCSMLRRTAEAGHGVAIFSLEMGQDEIAARCLADALFDGTLIPYGDILKGKLNAYQLERIKEAQNLFDGLPMLTDASPRLTVSEIAARARKAKVAFEGRGTRLTVVCVDHMGLVAPSGRYAGNKVQETAEVSNALRALAKELDCCVLMLSQLSREVEKRDDKRPVMSDLRWAGEIEQDAHVIAFLYRPAYYLAQEMNVDPNDIAAARDRLEFLIRKNRNGETSDVTLRCNIAQSAVRERS